MWRTFRSLFGRWTQATIAVVLGVLCGSLVSALLGLAWGLALQRRYRRQAALAAA